MSACVHVFHAGRCVICDQESGDPDARPARAPHGKTHLLKCWPEFFRAIQRGQKRFEIRRNDRDYQVGDCLVLKEFEPDTQTYSGQQLAERVIYMTVAFQQPEFVVLGIEHVGCLSPTGQVDAALVVPHSSNLPVMTTAGSEFEGAAGKPQTGDPRLSATSDGSSQANAPAALVAPREPALLTDEQREQMKRDSHYDPLRELLRTKVDELRRDADAIQRYLSSPSQCQETFATRYLVTEESAALVAGLRQALQDTRHAIDGYVADAVAAHNHGVETDGVLARLRALIAQLEKDRDTAWHYNRSPDSEEERLRYACAADLDGVITKLNKVLVSGRPTRDRDEEVDANVLGQKRAVRPVSARKEP